MASRKKHLEKEIQELRHNLAAVEVRIHRAEREIRHLRKAVRELLGRLERSATLTFINSKTGETMPLTAHVNDVSGTFVFTEFDGPAGTGGKVPPIGPVTNTSDNTSVAVVDPTSGQLAYIGPGVANITGLDAGNGLTASDVLTLTANVAVSATGVLVAGGAIKS